MNQNIFDNPIFFEKYIELRSSSISHNELIEKPLIYSLLPSLNGKRVLDIGCGFGDFSFFAAQNNSEKIIAVDLSKKMIEISLSKNKFSNISFINDDIMNLDFESNSFDIVYSSLVLHYIEDVSLLINNVFRWLKSNSIFVLSIEHPINTACPNSWIYDNSGRKIGWALKNYDIEGKRIFNWFVNDVEKYHRKVDTYIDLFKKAGFEINVMKESIISDDVLKQNPNLEYEKIRPPYLFFSLIKK
jgi:ubiquinone/menaquinone biosynthesis C-methylase UbiE